MRTKNNHSLKVVLSNNLFLFKLFFQAAPVYMILSIVEMIRNELVIFLEFTIGFNYVLECAEFGRPFSEAVIFLVCLLTFVVIGLLFNAYLYQTIKMKSEPKMKQVLKVLLYNKSMEIDLECYDDPKFYNDYVLATSEAENQVGRMFDMMSVFFTGITSILISGAFFIIKDPISFIFIIASFGISLYTGKAMNKLNIKIRMEKNPYERKLSYTNRVFYLNDYSKEVRLNTEVSEELLKDFDEINDELLQIDRKNAKKRFYLFYLRNYISSNFIIDVIYMIYLVFSAAILHQISYSNVAVMRGTANRMKSRMHMFSNVYPRAEEISLYVEKIQDYLRIEPKIISTKNLKNTEKSTLLELKNVSFGYSKSDGYILNNISMTIKPGSKIAIVGFNGSGKTTLIKLIMRLYDPNEGEILLDGVNIKEYNIKEYREKIGTIFQDFKIYSATIKENVLLDFADNDTDKVVVDSLEKSGFSDKLDTLSNGLSTILTTEFDVKGVNLSGGEGQKLAIARAFYKKANLIVLDEPSSSLDPIAEYHLNSSMLNAVDNKSVIFISHRLSTTRIADRIYVLDKGRIIEDGTHEELLIKGGQYATMWRAQAGQYVWDYSSKRLFDCGQWLPV